MFQNTKNGRVMPSGSAIFRRFPSAAYRPAEYSLFRKIREKNMYPIVNRWLKKLPPGNAEEILNLLDSRLLAVGLQSMVDLQQQRIQHLDAIHRLAARRSADCSDIIQLLEAEKDAMEILQEEHRETCRLIKELEKGAQKNV